MKLSPGLVLPAVLVAVAAPAAEQASFRADSKQIQAGATAKLSWQWEGATRGYLSSVGDLAKPSGDTVSVAPTETTSYILILERPGLPAKMLTIGMAVTGAKGSSGDWPGDPFVPLPYQADYDLPSTSFVSAAARVQKVLREDWGFEIRQFAPMDNELVFVTKYLQTPRLNEPNESLRRYRRIAYRIDLRPVAQQIHFNLSTSIEWRNAVETRWFPENSSTSNRYQVHTSSMWNALKAN